MKTGFTLIELLVVITILAILAGAALPYVQSYVLESRISKAKADIEEIGRALCVYETREKTYQAGDVSQLTGRYLNKAPIDPWGKPYIVATAAGVVLSAGPDRQTGTAQTSADDIAYNYQPPLSLVQVKWVDRNQTGAVDTQNSPDQVQFIFSRALRNDLSAFQDPALDANFRLSDGTNAMKDVFNDTIGSISVMASTTVVMDLKMGSGAFVPGSDTIQIKNGHSLYDLAGNKALASQQVIILPQ